MRDLSDHAFAEFQQVACQLRRERLDLETRLDRLDEVRAQADKIIAESKARIERAFAVFHASPSIVPAADSNSAFPSTEPMKKAEKNARRKRRKREHAT